LADEFKKGEQDTERFGGYTQLEGYLAGDFKEGKQDTERG
jgi:hypothetical protein